jgi:4,5-DOPA dioxygenase extradiol
VLFLGHGSPMNALGGNEHARALNALGAALPRPRAIAVVSAHWRTSGTRVLDVAAPRTIHDFGGFPRALYELTYPAPGAPELATRIVDLLAAHEARPDASWGLDHGAWAVLRHLYPAADLPTLQISLDRRLDLAGHFAVGQALAPLRDEGVLLVASGNLTHNLGDFEPDPAAPEAAWAEAFDATIARAVEARDLDVLLGKKDLDASAWRRAHPTLEHYQPLLYAVAAAGADAAVSYPITGLEHGTLSMRSIVLA